MAKKTKEPSAFPRVNNSQTFSTLRLIPAINQKNYFTNYLKKDSQYLCRKIRERSEESAQETCVFHIGSTNLRVGLSSDSEPKVLPFNVGKLSQSTPSEGSESAAAESSSEDYSKTFTGEEEEALAEVRQSFVDRMKFYKTRIVNGAQETCRDFNSRQKGESAGESIPNEKVKGVVGSEYSGVAPKYYCVGPKGELPEHHKLYWPLQRGRLNEDPQFYRSPQEVEADIHDILYYATYSEHGISLAVPEKRNNNKRFKKDSSSHSSAEIKPETPENGLKSDIFSDFERQQSNDKSQLSDKSQLGDKSQKDHNSTENTEDDNEAADAVLVIPDMFDRNALSIFVRSLFSIGFQYVAVIEEAVAATYGAGISGGCVVDIGAQTTTVACVEDGLCIPDSRVHLDFGSADMTTVFGKLLNQIDFPGDPDYTTLDALKRQFFTVNEVDISVQLYRYYTRNLKFDFKVYNEVMLPVLGLFYPHLFGEVVSKPYTFRNSLFKPQIDPYTGHIAGPLSDADINVRMQTLAVLNMSYHNETVSSIKQLDEDEEASQLDDEDESRMGTPVVESTNNGTTGGNGNGGNGNGTNVNGTNGTGPQNGERSLTQTEAFESLDPTLPVQAPLDHAIIESIAQAQKHSGSAKMYYENILVVGGGSKIPSFYQMLSDRLVMWNQAHLKEIGEVAVMAIPQGTDAESICWRGGCVYSKLKIVDEMWTSSDEWDVLGSRTLHYKAALYAY